MRYSIMKLLYIHGYGTTGQAYKAQLLQSMFPSYELLAPTVDYAAQTPFQIFQKLRDIITQQQPALIMGSSLGGYYALCCAGLFRGPIWCINPVRDIVGTLCFLEQHIPPEDETIKQLFPLRMEEYQVFDRTVFQQITIQGKLYFALSTDDETLGDHRPLLNLFPNYEQVVWKDDCGHSFLRFEELKESIAASLD